MSGEMARRASPVQFSLGRLLLAITLFAVLVRGIVAVATLKSTWWIACVSSIGPAVVAGSLLAISLTLDADFDVFVPGAALLGSIGIGMGVQFGAIDGAMGMTVLWFGVNGVAFGGGMTACSLGYLRGAAAMVVVGLYFPWSVLYFIFWLAAR